MIARTDIIVPAPLAPALALDASVRTIVRHWPDAVIVDGEDKQVFHRHRDVPFRKLTDIMVFKDRHSLNDWREHGPTSSNINSMINLVWLDNQLTIVVDDASDPAIQGIIEGIKSILRQPIFNIAA
jgi:hypothetical protein